MTELQAVSNQIPATTPGPGEPRELEENKLSAREITPLEDRHTKRRKGGWQRKIDKLAHYKADAAYLAEACEALLTRDVSPFDTRIIARELQRIREKLEGDTRHGH